MSENVKILKHTELPVDEGFFCRLVCLTGDRKGTAYLLTGKRIVIGRSEKADIRLNDSKTSREHCEITQVGADWFVTDLNSQNGVLINNDKIKQKKIEENDKLIVGQTVFKFSKLKGSGRLTKKVKSESDESSGKHSSRSFLPFVTLLVIFAGLFLFDGKKSQKVSVQKGQTINLQQGRDEYESALRKRDTQETKKNKAKIRATLQRGLRELREKNYYRAIHEFNLALVISPENSQAEYYVRRAKEELDREIEAYMVKAQRDQSSLKFDGALISYCAIVRLLYNLPNDPRHKSAVKQINNLEEKLGIEPGETDCLKKSSTLQ